MEFFKKHSSSPHSDAPKRDGDFYKKRVLDEVDAGSVPKIGSNSNLVMKPILRLRFVDPTSKEVGISVLIFTTGDVLGPEDIPLTVSSQTDPILPTKLLVYDGCASWVYEMRMFQQAKDTEVTYSIGSIQRKFYLCGYESFNAAFFSCNGRKRVADEIAMEEAGGIAGRWQDAYQETTKRQTSLLIGMGDQLYMDFFQSMDEMIKFWALPIEKQAVEPFPPETEEKLRKLYFWKYLYTFSRPNFNDTMGNTLTMFVWDDHEIFDGYGSYPPGQQASPTFQGAFKIAKWAYRLFQHHFTSYYLTSNLVNQRSKLYFGKSLHTVYHLGQVTIFNIDARSERSKMQIVSAHSYIEMQRQIQQIPQTCQHLLIICTIPLIFPQLTNAVNALEQVATIFPKLYAKIPGDPLDDFMDQWRSTHHLTERKFLVELLQETAKKRGVRCSIFSGDVHVGCVGKIMPIKPLPSEQEDYRVIYNMTTSGISSKYSPAMRNAIYNLCVYNNKKGDHIGANTTMHSLGVMVPFESSSHVESDHPERDRMVVGRNNWAIVTLENKHLVFELRALPTVEQHKDAIPDLITYKTTIPNLEWKRNTNTERIFRIEVVTSDMNLGGVTKPDSISIILSDEEKTKSEDIFFTKLEGYNTNILRSGQKDIFKYTSSKLVGEIAKCTVKKSSTFSQYHLNRIDVIDEQTHETYTFVFNKWIEKDHESKYNTKRSITVFTLEAKHLRLSGFGYPTTKVTYGGQTVFKTSAQPSTNPCWTMAYSSFVPKAIQENVLEVSVVEEDLVRKERLCFGKVSIDLNKYPKGQIIDDWFEIKDTNVFEDELPAKTEKETVTQKLEKKLSQKKEEMAKMEVYTKYTKEQPLTSTNDPILINIWNNLISMGIPEHDRQDIINYIKKKQTKPTIHLRIHYFSKFPEIGTNQRLFFDEDIYADIKTGDVIAYCGIHLISKLIQGKTGVAVSHLGIALRIKPREWGEKKRLPDIGEEIHNPDQEMIFVVEATSNLYKKPDYFDDKIRKGVNIFALHDRLRTTDMRSAWHYPLTTPLDEDQQKKLIGYLKDQYDKGVQYDMKQMLLNGFVHDQEEDLSTLFCSELVAAAMKNVGIVQCNPSIMSPGEVVGLNIFKHDTPKILAYV